MTVKSNVRDWTTPNAHFCAGFVGSRGATDALFDTVSLSAATHCCCSGVIVAEPSDSCLMRVKLSTIAPTKRLIETKQPIIIQTRKNAALPYAKSFRTGATPTPCTSIPAHINSSHASPVDEMYRIIIDEPKSSNDPNGGLSHSIGTSSSEPPPPPLRARPRCRPRDGDENISRRRSLSARPRRMRRRRSSASRLRAARASRGPTSAAPAASASAAARSAACL